MEGASSLETMPASWSISRKACSKRAQNRAAPPMRWRGKNGVRLRFSRFIGKAQPDTNFYIKMQAALLPLVRISPETACALELPLTPSA